MILLVAENIYKTFYNGSAAVDALNGVSITVPCGEILSIVGPSGCGKTTLLNIIAGIELPTSGAVTISKMEQIGYVPQRDLLLPWRTVLQNITLGLEISSQVSTGDIRGIYEATKRHGIEKFLDTYPDVLSGGMRQLVSFIRTLVIEPRLFL